MQFLFLKLPIPATGGSGIPLFTHTLIHFFLFLQYFPQFYRALCAAAAVVKCVNMT